MGELSPGWYAWSCFVCARPLDTPDVKQRLCSDCREECWEGLAHALDPTYDPGRVNDGEDLWRRLWLLYGVPA